MREGSKESTYIFVDNFNIDVYGGFILAGVGDNDDIAADDDAASEEEDDDDVKSSMTLLGLGNVAKPIAKMMIRTITMTNTLLSISM